jgi:hypothetical protein
LKPRRKAVVMGSDSGLSEVVVKQPKTDRFSRAVMRPTKLGPRPRVKAGASRPGAAAKKNEKEAQCLQLRWKLVCWRG